MSSADRLRHHQIINGIIPTESEFDSLVNQFGLPDSHDSESSIPSAAPPPTSRSASLSDSVPAQTVEPAGPDPSAVPEEPSPSDQEPSASPAQTGGISRCLDAAIGKTNSAVTPSSFSQMLPSIRRQ